MRILYADLDREWRGGQSQALLTLHGLLKAGHQVDLVAAERSPLSQRAIDLGINVHLSPRFGLRAWAAKSLAQLSAKEEYRLAHLNEPHALTAAWLAGLHRKMPLLLSRRIGFPLQKNWVSRARFRSVERFVANSENVAKSLVDSGVLPERISIVNEGVEIPALPDSENRVRARKRWGIGESEFLFGCVGVFVPEKGQRHLIEALPAVRRKYPHARLLLAGDGVCRTELESLAVRLEQREAVLFPGFVKDVNEVYAALDAFLFPSEFEGLGTALQAAMAMALPSISTARGALKEVVDNQRTALVVEPNAEEFAEAMLLLMDAPALGAKLGPAAREEAIARFSAKRMVSGTIRVYEEVLASWIAKTQPLGAR
ncbi:MAG: glycosyltransferase family 4 protein [Candidatus Acidiferrum sp.]